MADGYSGYDEVVAVNGIARAGCWAHARRKFKDALDVGTESAATVMNPIQRLFHIERVIKRLVARKQMSCDEMVELRKLVRQRHSVPAL